MAERNESSVHFETLQVSPDAEPEVIAAAYRALAKKYHPDRSTAPDAIVRMARINVAFQALRSRSGRVAATESKIEPAAEQSRRISFESVDPNAPLEQILAAVTRMVTSARQCVIDEVTGDGLSRDLAASLVNTALRSLHSGRADVQAEHRDTAEEHLDPASSYDAALRYVTERARRLKEQMVDDLVQDGLARGAASELSQLAFEQSRAKTRATPTGGSRLTAERVDLAASMDRGVRVAAGKLQAARQRVVEEITRDGVPQRVAEQLVDAASKTLTPRSA